MATKKKPTKKSPHLRKVRAPASHLEQLLEQSKGLSALSAKGWCKGTISEVLEEIMKALAPIRYLKNAAIDFSEDLDEFIVNGYLTLFLLHMDSLLAQAEIMAKEIEQEKLSVA